MGRLYYYRIARYIALRDGISLLQATDILNHIQSEVTALYYGESNYTCLSQLLRDYMIPEEFTPYFVDFMQELSQENDT